MVQDVLTPERLVMEHIMLVAILHANVGTEVSIFHYLKICFLVFICIDLAFIDPGPIIMKLIAMSFYLHSVLRIRDVYPGSLIRLFSIPDPNCLPPGSRILIKEFKYFNPKKPKNGF